jgi:hypothetical protein
VADASGGAASVAAVVKGFRTMRSASHILGVLVNRVSSRAHYELVRGAVERYAGVPAWDTSPGTRRGPSRAGIWGLVPAAETPGIFRQIDRAAGLILETRGPRKNRPPRGAGRAPIKGKSAARRTCAATGWVWRGMRRSAFTTRRTSA